MGTFSTLGSTLASAQQLGKLTGTSATQAVNSLNPMGTLGLSATYGVSTPTSTVTDAVAGAQVLTGANNPLSAGAAGASNPVWSPNILSSVEQPAYHIRFYVTQDSSWDFSNAKSYADFKKNAIDSLGQTTIAESGVTGLNVQSLTMDTIAAPNDTTRSFSATGMVLTIAEPMGVSFFDMMVNAAAELKIKNYTKFFYFLEISFKGYENGNPIPNICASYANAGTWLYQVTINDIAVDSNATGSIYTLKLMPNEEMTAFDQDTFTLPEPFTPAASTIGGVLAELAKMLNDSNQRNYGYQLTDYDFATIPLSVNNKVYDPSTWTITPKDIDWQDQRSMAMSTDASSNQGASQTGHFARGMKIGDVLDAIFQASPDAQRLAKDVQQQTEIIKTDGKMRTCVLLRYEPCVITKDYDFYYEQYKKSITFHIKSYITTKPSLHHDDIKDASDDNLQKTNALQMNQAGYMCKRYDYMFTGLNTEVLNFDFKYNFAWNITLPRLAGFQNSTTATTIQAKVNPSITGAGDDPVQADLAKANADYAKATDTATAANDKLAAATANPSGISSTDMTKLQNDAKEASVAVQAAKDKVTTLGKAAAKTAAAFNADQQNKLGVGRTSGVKYAEDLLAIVEQPRIPLSIKQDNADPRYNANGPYPETWTRDRAMYATILDQVNSPITNSLMQITLEIKGDPYWLGDGNMARMIGNYLAAQNKIARQHMSENTERKDLMDPSYGDIMLLLTFRFSSGVNEDGSPILSVNNSFTGVYAVRSVQHTFAGGAFKQVLTCQRMEKMDAFKAFNAATLNNTATPVLATSATSATAAAASNLTGANPSSSVFIPASMTSSVSTNVPATSSQSNNSLFTMNGSAPSQFSVNPPPTTT
jgi:hypothetical protein